MLNNDGDDLLEVLLLGGGGWGGEGVLHLLAGLITNKITIFKNLKKCWYSIYCL